MKGRPKKNQTGFVIEAGVPVPNYRKMNVQYPLELLKPDESFFIPKDKGMHSVVNHISKIHKSKTNTRYFTTRIETNGKEVLGRRVWRVK